MNVAVGGEWPGAPDASTSFPQRMVVDHVREYAPADVDGASCPHAAGGSTEVDGRTVCDLDGDGLFRDVDGDGEVAHADVREFFAVQHRPAWKRPDRFDFNGNDVVGHGDVVALFEHVATGQL